MSQCGALKCMFDNSFSGRVLTCYIILKKKSCVLNTQKVFLIAKSMHDLMPLSSECPESLVKLNSQTADSSC